MRFTGKVAWVTGAARGIGFAIASALAKEGADLGINDLRPLDEVASKLKGMGRSILAMLADVTNARQVEEIAEKIVKEFGRIDVLVNNAGGGLNVPFSIVEMQEEDWDKVVNLNLKGAFLCCRVVIPHMRKQGKGSIVNIASLAGRSSATTVGPAYTGAKAGLLGLTRHLARTEGPYGIRVNAVSPGSILTEHLAQRFESYPKEEQEKRLSSTPLQRFGKPEEVAAAVLFLASDEASFITGANIDVNGGRFMQM
ncbi:MAG: SDR family oxidoreductase [Deltaproteobacteria bacterium]|nr:SDR family oxidoreductase [Deltaproteobacteria bacterium]